MYEYDDIIETIIPEDTHLEICRMYNEQWMKDALIRYQYVEEKEKLKEKCPYL